MSADRSPRRRNNFHILGPTYIDITLAPIDDVRLKKTEVSNLDPLTVEVGGSGVYVGRYLSSQFKKSSFLYTRFGANERLPIDVKKLVEEEPWVKKVVYETDPHVQSGVSVHLVQRDNAFYTTLTHRGVASRLRWEWCSTRLQRQGMRGGCLIITGIFRTNLTTNLCESLKKIPPNMITILDSGLYNRAEHSKSERAALRDAFSQNLIDVYICSPDELRHVMSTKDDEIGLNSSNPIGDALQAYAQQPFRIIPRITIARLEISSSKADVYLAVDNDVKRITALPTKSGDYINNAMSQQPGLRNALTATVAHRLTEARSELHQGRALGFIAADAVQEGLHRVVGNRSG